MELLSNIWETVEQLARNVGNFLLEVARFAITNGALLLSWSLLIVWLAWWLKAVNWPKLWPVLRKGAWMPLVLLCILAALVWSRLAPGHSGPWPVFWGHLALVGCWALSALVCGWLQGLLHWTPAEINLNPPPHGHDHHAHH